MDDLYNGLPKGPLRFANFLVDRSIFGDFWAKNTQKFGKILNFVAPQGQLLYSILVKFV